jgi:hypothetical protein
MLHDLALPQRTAYEFGHYKPMTHDIPIAICHHPVFVRTADGVVAVFVVFYAKNVIGHYLDIRDLMAEIITSFVLSSASRYMSIIFSPSLSHDFICFKFIIISSAMRNPS